MLGSVGDVEPRFLAKLSALAISGERRANSAAGLFRFLGADPEFSAGEQRRPVARRLITHHHGVEFSCAPLFFGVVRRKKMVPAQIEQHAFFLPTNDSEIPAMLCCLGANGGRKADERVAPGTMTADVIFQAAYPAV